MATKPKAYEQPTYTSEYQGRLDSALDSVTNRQEFTYDPLKDANYQALSKLYNKQGEQAAQNTLGDAAALNGGYGSSYAVTASQQARNDYNQKLAAQIPALQEAAYNRYVNDYNMNISALGALQDAEDRAYNQYRDKVSDAQWKYGADYQEYRDNVADSQWQKAYDYQAGRDKIEDAQWQKTYDRGVYESNRDYNYQVNRDKVADSQWAKEYALQKKSAASSSYSTGGGTSGGYSGYIGGGSGSSGGSTGGGSNIDDIIGQGKDKVKEESMSAPNKYVKFKYTVKNKRK